jgi:hypothetical protein
MPSPFPGMDPYLEAPHIWPDFHAMFVPALGGLLNASLPNRLYAIQRSTREDFSEYLGRYPFVEPQSFAYLELRNASQYHELLAVIEFAQPTRKRDGRDRKSYLRRRDEFFDHQVSIVEIDLLRDGERLLRTTGAPFPEPAAFDYIACVFRRSRPRQCELYVWGIRDRLPILPLPLGPPHSDAALDLQAALDAAYDRGPYRRGAVDYSAAPPPPLRDHDVAWATDLVRQAFPPPQ